MKVHFIQQDSWVKPGEYLAWAERHGYDVTITKCWEYETIPKSAEADMLVVLDGYQCPATTKEECGYIDAEQEKDLIRRYVGAGRMVIGVCLGAQLVGEALGAHMPTALKGKSAQSRRGLLLRGKTILSLSPLEICFWPGSGTMTCPV